jgi:hypothetical protein
MTQIVHRMRENAVRLTNFDVDSYLRTNNAGRRLAAYAYLYARPDPAWATALAQAVLTDDKPFNEYWALRALEAQRVPVSALDRDVVRRLRARLPELAGDAGRHGILRRLLDGGQ